MRQKEDLIRQLELLNIDDEIQFVFAGRNVRGKFRGYDHDDTVAILLGEDENGRNIVFPFKINDIEDLKAEDNVPAGDEVEVTVKDIKTGRIIPIVLKKTQCHSQVTIDMGITPETLEREKESFFLEMAAVVVEGFRNRTRMIIDMRINNNL